ncbi:MAG TPA: DedA family protein [Candidatus Deferrimicrobium sp.]|nr:DedA family protein [Candidatus Deferrimicrobium sp.]
MEFAETIIDIVVHLDRHLKEMIDAYGGWTYAILFVIIFCETGFVVTPFLPGDSLLFAAGAFAATGVLDPWVVLLLLSAAAILGDTVNYWIGERIGDRAYAPGRHRFLKPEYLAKTHGFYEKYGAKTIVIARFVPIVRTFAPFLAGVGTMTYRRFLTYNVVGGVLWTMVFVWGGYFFGNLPFVKKNFTFVILAIILLSVMPAVIEFFRERRARGKGK